MTDWIAMTERSLEELAHVDERYRPTNFWGPGLDKLLHDLRERGLPSFKSWPQAAYWFYPHYGMSFTDEQLDAVTAHAHELNPRTDPVLVRDLLTGMSLARRDFDAARLAWDHRRWPLRLARFGESSVGERPEFFPLTFKEHGWTRPYLNYMLCMAALSRHVDTPPTSFLELGGGFGSLGEFLLTRGPQMRYVDLDIPPLLTVASYYLRTLFGGRVSIAEDLPSEGPLSFQGSAVLPNWRLRDVAGPFDVFVNSFSFQEMEPDVVEHYISLVAAKDVEFVVSLNSRLGKPRLSDGHAIGVQDPVTSSFIVEQFERRGYSLLGRDDNPLVRTRGQLVVLRRTDAIPRPSRGYAVARSLAGRAVRLARRSR